MWWLLACTRQDVRAEFVPGEWTPAAGRVVWDGPAGAATLSVDDGPHGAWRVIASEQLIDGETGLPVALVPAGSWRFRLDVDGLGTESDLQLPEPPIPTFSGEAGEPSRSEMSQAGYWVGYTFAFRWEHQDAVPIIIDGQGRVVWWAPPDPGGGLAMRVEPTLDGRGVLVLEDFEDGDQRVVHRYALDGSARDTIPAPGASHDFAERDGSLAYIAYQRSDREGIPGQPLPTASDVVTTIPLAEGGPPVQGFSFLDDFPRDPWYTCSHAAFDAFVPGAAEWTHTNTVLASPTDASWILGVRQLDAILAVEGNTRLWQVGGEDATRPGVELHHPHLSEAWSDADGVLHLLVFDNGNHRPAPIVSRVVEIAVHEDHAEEVAAWPDPAGRFSAFLGGANRLPGGNTLVAWSPHGDLVEYTPDGEAVWSWTLDGPIGRGVWTATLTP